MDHYAEFQSKIAHIIRNAVKPLLDQCKTAFRSKESTRERSHDRASDLASAHSSLLLRVLCVMCVCVRVCVHACVVFSTRAAWNRSSSLVLKLLRVRPALVLSCLGAPALHPGSRQARRPRQPPSAHGRGHRYQSVPYRARSACNSKQERRGRSAIRARHSCAAVFSYGSRPIPHPCVSLSVPLLFSFSCLQWALRTTLRTV